MSGSNNTQEQNTNTAKIVISAFYKIVDSNGATAGDVTKYLQQKFGDVWKENVLTSKAEETLESSAALGFLDKHGKKYIDKLTRGLYRCKRRYGGRRKLCSSKRQVQRRRRRTYYS
ncbi:hypothetical protein RR48_14155 [Papilio machaon]|uniref:Uncharacterized protein n=1 Tax=Papilio machaon TaxID=76193 RepID=A0A194QS98_PAPMA|nr:hypothetical protein RR48_14155 [Papilio machaon]